MAQIFQALGICRHALSLRISPICDPLTPNLFAISLCVAVPFIANISFTSRVVSLENLLFSPRCEGHNSGCIIMELCSPLAVLPLLSLSFALSVRVPRTR